MMMRGRLWGVLALACALSSCGPADSDVFFTPMGSGGGTQFGASIDGVMWNWNVTSNDVKDTPDWAPGQEPAVSMAEAIRLAQIEMVKYADRADAYKLDHVEFLPVGGCCDPNHEAKKWVYVVDFERKERFASGARGTIRIPVLLDGRAIAGVREDAPAARP